MLTDGELIETLQVVDEVGSVAEAGRQMYLNRKAVVYRLQKLQERYETPLFVGRRGSPVGERNGGGQTRLTPFGKQLVNGGKR